VLSVRRRFEAVADKQLIFTPSARTFREKNLPDIRQCGLNIIDMVGPSLTISRHKTDCQQSEIKAAVMVLYWYSRTCSATRWRPLRMHKAARWVRKRYAGNPVRLLS
jgi:hypothetical protein